VLNGAYSQRTHPDKRRRIKVHDAETAKTFVFLTNTFAPRSDHRRTLQMPLEGRTLPQVDQAVPAHQDLLRHPPERRAQPDLDRRLGLTPRRQHQKTPQDPGQSRHNPPDPQPHRSSASQILSLTVFEKIPFTQMLDNPDYKKQNH
jgi:hypothetical protein